MTTHNTALPFTLFVAMDLNQLADSYQKSITGDTCHFEQFLVDYFDLHPQRAFENLKTSQASRETHFHAEKFNQVAFDTLMDKVKDEVQGLHVDPLTSKGRVLHEFFRDYFEGCEFEISWDNLQRKISQDPELRADNDFNTLVKKMGEKVRPQQKERKEISNQEDEAVFIKIRLGLQKRFEQKLTHVDLKAILSDTLKGFYGAHLADPSAKAALEVKHEVESITKSLKIPLALKLAQEDTSRLSEKITVELRNLDKRTRTIRDLSFQGVKFDFTDDDLKKAVESEKSPRLDKTGTEKIEIIRDLVIDLNRKPAHEAFPDAIKRARQEGDLALTHMLVSYSKTLGAQNSLAGQASMLFDGYKLYVKADMTGYKADVTREAEGLSKGIKIEAIRLGLDEIEKKTNAIITSTAMNRFYTRAIHSLPQEVLKAYRLDPILQGIQNVEKRTGVKVNIANATAPAQSGGKGKGTGLGSHMN